MHHFFYLTHKTKKQGRNNNNKRNYLATSCGKISRVSGSPRRTANPPESNNAFRSSSSTAGGTGISRATYHPQRGTDKPDRRGYERPRKRHLSAPFHQTHPSLSSSLLDSAVSPTTRTRRAALMLVLRSSASDTTGIEQGSHHPGSETERVQRE